MSDQWSAAIFDLQSGNELDRVNISPDSAFGHGDLTPRKAGIRIHGGDGFDRAHWRDLIGRWYDRALVFLCDGRAVSESLIVNAPQYNRHTRTVTVDHIGVPTLLERRWMHGVGTSDGGGGYDPRGEFKVSGVSVSGAVIRVLQQAYTAAVSPAWPIPVQLPSVEPGSFEQTWYFHQFQNAAAMIRDLTSREDGPKIDLRPEIDADGRLTRVLRVGTLTGPRFDVFLDAEESAVESHNFGLYGEDTATGIHFPGKGEDEDMKVGAAFLNASAGLARDDIFFNKTEDNVQKLVEQAKGYLKKRSSATERWSLTVKTRKLNPADLRIGSTIGIHSDEGLWEPDFTLASVVGFSGACAETYSIELEGVTP